MKCQIFRGLILATVLAGGTCSVADDDLDAALEARKKKVTHRVYSERARLDDQALLIPQTPNEEILALERDLAQLEQKLKSRPAMNSGVAPPPPAVRVPEKPDNWITPSLLDEGLPAGNSDPVWISEEFGRQKSLQKQKADQEKEEALVNKMLRQNSRQSFSTESSQLNQYENTLRNTITPPLFQSAAKSVLADPLASLRQKEKKKPAGSGALFSPVARANSSVFRAPFSPRSSSPQSSGWQSQFGSSGSKQSLPTSKLDWNGNKTKSLTPVERVRRSSPIYRKDPFADDFIPGIKTSIWD